MGGGGSGGDNGLAEQQLALQRESLEQSKKAVTEPIKSVQSNMEGASDDAAKAAMLRRGIASTFNRKTAFTSGGKTSGGSAKLGE